MVVNVLERLIRYHGKPKVIRTDNGSEFMSRVVDSWAYKNGIKQDFISPGKPVENCYIESFNGKFRDECLNQHYFTDLNEARETIEMWREDYNTVRPHQSLNDLTPEEFKNKLLVNNCSSTAHHTPVLV
jgi:putative transposase